MVGMYKSLLK
uniref:Uncharacterized protein n=1 Tax=Anguilla anguilla TaxID=7936 RepID=A0A0E9XS34_ANGAN